MSELSGALAGVGLPAIVRFLTGLKKTGCLRITAEAWHGEIYFASGELTHAALGSRHGLPALDALVIGQHGSSFEFDSDASASIAPNIALSTEDTLAYLDLAASQASQSAALRLPALDAVPSFAEQSGDAASGEEPLPLDRATLQTLLAVDGRRTVREIITQRGSFDALWQLSSLVDVGLVRLEVPPMPAPAPAEPSNVRPIGIGVVAEPFEPVRCPRLGFEDDPNASFGRPTRLHRCFAAGMPLALSLDQQRELCISEQFGTCPRLAIAPPARATPASSAPPTAAPPTATPSIDAPTTAAAPTATPSTAAPTSAAAHAPSMAPLAPLRPASSPASALTPAAAPHSPLAPASSSGSARMPAPSPASALTPAAATLGPLTPAAGSLAPLKPASSPAAAPAPAPTPAASTPTPRRALHPVAPADADDPRIVRLPVAGRVATAPREAVADRPAVGAADPSPRRAGPTLGRGEGVHPTPLRARQERNASAAAAAAVAEPKPATAEGTSRPARPPAVVEESTDRRVVGPPARGIFAGLVLVIVLAASAFLFGPRLADLFSDETTVDLSMLPNSSAIAAGTPISEVAVPRAPTAAAPTSSALNTTPGGSPSGTSATDAEPRPALSPEPAAPPPTPASAASAAVEAPAKAATPTTVLDERFTSNERNWPSNAQGTAVVSSGSYRLVPRTAGQFVAIGAPIASVLRDVVVSATFHKVSGPSGGGYGIIVRDQAPAPQNGTGQDGAYYVLEAGDRGEVGIWRRDGDRWVDLLPWQKSDAVKSGSASNDLTVRAIGNKLTLSVNGAEVATRTDSTLAQGLVGIFVGGDGNQVAVDRFTLQTL